MFSFRLSLNHPNIKFSVCIKAESLWLTKKAIQISLSICAWAFLLRNMTLVCGWRASVVTLKCQLALQALAKLQVSTWISLCLEEKPSLYHQWCPSAQRLWISLVHFPQSHCLRNSGIWSILPLLPAVRLSCRNCVDKQAVRKWKSDLEGDTCKH